MDTYTIDKSDNKVGTKVQINNIPAELQARNQWVLWKYEERDGKRTKVLRNPLTLERAKASEPTTWASFAFTLDTYNKLNQYDGIGYVFDEQDPYTGVDIDHCITDGELSPVARKIVNVLDTYTEISPSGTGVKMIVRAKKLGPACKDVQRKIEIYDNRRFFTLTGNRLAGTPEQIGERQSEIDRLYVKLFGEPTEAKPTREPQPNSLEDDELLERAFLAADGEKMRALYLGDEKYITEHYNGDHSSADQALANKLAFWCGGEAERIDRLFRNSGLMREKWERDDYRTRTITRAIDSCENFYEPHEDLSAKVSEICQADYAAVQLTEIDAGDDLAAGEKTEPTEEEKPKQTNGRRFLSPSQLRALPPPKWLVANHFTEGSHGMVYGAYGSGKSFVAFDMACCLTTGKYFLGRFPVIQGPVVYIAGEGYAGYKGRLAAWEKHYGLMIPDDNFRLVDLPYPLVEVDEASRLVRDIAGNLKTPPVAIIIDTVARSFGSAVESATEDMNRYVENVDRIGRSFNSLVLNIHHKGKDEAKGARGSSSLPGACDAIFEISGKPSEGVAVQCKKQKDGDSDLRYDLKMIHYPLTDSAAGSIVLVPLPEDEQALKSGSENLRQCGFILADQYAEEPFGFTEAFHHVASSMKAKDPSGKLREVAKSTYKSWLQKLEQLGFVVKHGESYRIPSNKLALLTSVGSY